MNNLKEKLTKALLAAGARQNQFSINDPRDYVLNFQASISGYQVWFQNQKSDFERKTFTNLGQAVYEFAARLVPGYEARAIAKQFGDHHLPLYSS